MCNCSQNSSNVPNGINGYNAFTITTADYVQPAVNTPISVNVSNNGQYTGEWAIPNQTVFVEDGGYYTVVSSTATAIVIKYLTEYEEFNKSLAAVGDTVAAGSYVSPSGKRGLDGSVVIYAYNDLTGIGNNNAIGADTLISATIPADTLVNAGDELDIDIEYEYTDSDDVVVSFKFGGSTIQSYHEVGADSTQNIVNIKISTISTGTQMWCMTKQSFGTVYNGLVYQTSSNATLSASNNFEIVANNLVLGADQVVVRKCVIKRNKMIS